MSTSTLQCWMKLPTWLLIHRHRRMFGSRLSRGMWPKMSQHPWQLSVQLWRGLLREQQNQLRGWALIPFSSVHGGERKSVKGMETSSCYSRSGVWAYRAAEQTEYFFISYCSLEELLVFFLHGCWKPPCFTSMLPQLVRPASECLLLFRADLGRPLLIVKWFEMWNDDNGNTVLCQSSSLSRTVDVVVCFF